jgi:hypothetical protein
LTELRCHHVDVFLPALAVIAPQLRSLTLRGCLLHSWVARQDTYAFALGWNELVELDVTWASVDSKVADVHMPNLKKLCVAGFCIENDDKDSTLLHRSLQAFGHGCPQCTYLEYEPLVTLRHAPYADFPALVRLQLRCSPWRLSPIANMLRGPDVVMPTTLTALECMSTAGQSLDDSVCSIERCIPLPDVLSVAAFCIRSGAPLRSLCLAQCHTRMADESGHPDWFIMRDIYARLGAKLQGLTHLDMTASPLCSHDDWHPLVRAAPDLKKLDMQFMMPRDHQKGDVLPSVLCSGLHEVVLTYVSWPEVPACDMQIGRSFFMNDTSSVHIIKLRVQTWGDKFRVGDRLTVVLNDEIDDEDDDSMTVPLVVITKQAGIWELTVELQPQPQPLRGQSSDLVYPMVDFTHDVLGSWTHSLCDV